MTPPLSPPKRRRRRVVVTVTALVLGLYWFWPRVDQRFVGRWRVYNADDYDEWRFKSDGSGEFWQEFAGYPPPRFKHRFRWYFDGKKIVIRERYRDWREQIPLRLLFASSKTRFGIDNHFFTHPVYSIEPNRIRAEMFETVGMSGEEAAVTLDHVAD